MLRTRALWTTVLTSCVLASAASVGAQEPPAQTDATALAKASQNPVGDLISLPFPFNFNTGGGFADRTFFNLNFQPVMPIKVTPQSRSYDCGRTSGFQSIHTKQSPGEA